MSTGVVSVHRDSMRLDVHELVRQLNDALGPTLVATLAGTSDRKAPIRWAKHDSGRVSDTYQGRLRLAHRALTAIVQAEDAHVARAWFIGGNPLLDEDTPLTAIREDRGRDVMRAVRALVDDEWTG